MTGKVTGKAETDLLKKLLDFTGRYNITAGKVMTGVVGAMTVYYGAQYFIPTPKQHSSSSSSAAAAGVSTGTAGGAGKDAGKRSKKGAINREFFMDLRRLLGIVIPSVWSKEFMVLALHTLFLISRTFLSIQVAKLDGAIVKTIVERDSHNFIKSLLLWLVLAIPATYVNSMIRFLESKLAITFRSRLTHHLYGLYMTNETFYRVENLDSRLSNADQCLTEDAANFCSTLAHLHSQISKPALDVILITGQLIYMSRKKAGSGNASLAPIGLAFLAIWVTAKALKFISPPFGRLVAEQAALEGEFRHAHSRVITNAEEIAFYGGHKIERGALERAYVALVKHMNFIFKQRIFYNMAEGFFMKYLWSAVGLVMVALPGFYNKLSGHEHENDTVSARTQDFVIARGLLVNGADAVERILSSYKEVTELAGYTSRVSEMLKVFQDVGKGEYQKNVGLENKNVILNRGTVQEASYIRFEDVPIVSPNGDVLIEKLSFEARPGMHILITGPNGCGKSSLFRILGGLWPVYGGTVFKPAKERVFYIPQRPYLCVGSLRDQIIYPHTLSMMRDAHKTDADLLEILDWVHLSHIVEREGGLDATNTWQDVLSGGEKQRVAFARMLYHRPLYAILDECTSAVSIDVEGSMYTKAIELGITLLTVTHRPTLWKYHNWLLQFDGEGGWKYSELNAESRLSLVDEKRRLSDQLKDVPKIQKRLTELAILLGESPNSSSSSLAISDSDSSSFDQE